MEITSGITIYVGFWQQCESRDHANVASRCRYYQFSQSSLPAYFNFARWTICISAVFSLLSALLMFIANPCILKPENTSQNVTFSLRLLSSVLLLIGGVLTIVAGSWWSYTCYTNSLGPLIGPGTGLIEEYCQHTPLSTIKIKNDINIPLPLR